MKKNVMLITILCCGILASLSAQNKMRTKIDYRHSIEPIFSFYQGFNMDVEVKGSGDFYFPNQHSKGSMNQYYQFGVNYSCVLLPRLLMVTGAQYSNPAMQTNTSTLLSVKESTTNGDDYFRRQGVVLRRHIIEIPSMLRYTVSKGNQCKSYVEGGMQHQLYLATSYYTWTGNFNTEKRFIRENQSTYHMAAQVNIGSEFMLFGRIPAFTQINMVYQIDPMDQINRADRHFGIGLATGLRFRI